jgi:hypothetical protein
MRKSLSEILSNGSGESLRKAWDSTAAAGEFAPLPAGDYTAHVAGLELFNARTKNTPGVKITFKVIGGENAGRLLWHDCWLTEAALPQTKRDLAKLGITALEQLERPLPTNIRIRCTVQVTLRTEDDGTTYNRVKRFDVLGIDTPEVDAFAPDAAEPAGDADASFDPAALEDAA